MAAIPQTPKLTVEGLVTRTESGFHQVRVGTQVFVCRAPKRLLNYTRTTTTAVVIGDHVRAHIAEDDTGVIQEILPRRNELVRGAAGGSRFLDVIAANIDLLIVVHSLRDPDFTAARLDRLLLLAEAAEIPALICLNKVDLETPDRTAMISQAYRTIGYPVILTCAKTDLGIATLRHRIAGQISAMVGPSGAGKSSLLNAVQPGLRLRTAEISESTGKGKHTTTTAALLALDGGGYVADTPGLRELAIRQVEAEDVAWLFPEFRPYLPHCKFSNCTHREEMGCQVLEAVRTDGITHERHGSYCRVYEDVVEQHVW